MKAIEQYFPVVLTHHAWTRTFTAHNLSNDNRYYVKGQITRKCTTCNKVLTAHNDTCAAYISKKAYGIIGSRVRVTKLARNIFVYGPHIKECLNINAKELHIMT